MQAIENNNRSGKKILDMSAVFWFVTAAVGQTLFFIYIIAFYYKPTLIGNFEHWNKVLPKGYVQGDTTGNLFLAAHLLLAAIVTFGGLIQLIPSIRKNFIAVHRWNGRIYIVLAILIAIAGLYLLLTRGAIGGHVASLALGANGVLMIIFGLLAWSYARSKNFALHKIWAIRLFFMASGVWFFRVGLMLWLFIFRAPVGFDPESFTGPFLTFLYFACYILPLMFLELFFLAKKSSNKRFKITVALAILIATLMMAFGILAAVVGLWLPRISS